MLVPLWGRHELSKGQLSLHQSPALLQADVLRQLLHTGLQPCPLIDAEVVSVQINLVLTSVSLV